MTTALNAPASGDGTGPAPVGTGGMTVLVPAYFYPAGDRLADWARLAEAARSVPLEVIVNPASGPGKRQDPNYVTVVDALRRSGGRVLAYVDSDYGRRPLATVEADLRTYRSFYNVDGFFIDQMANTSEAVEHYRSIRRLIRQIDPTLKVVGNPGTSTRPEYLDTADTLVIFEGSAPDLRRERPSEGRAVDRRTPAPTGSPSSSTPCRPPPPAATRCRGRSGPARARPTSPTRRCRIRTCGLPPYWADEIAALETMNQLRNPVLATPQTPPSLPGD